MLIEEKYKEYSIFAYNKFFIEIGKNIIDKEYKEVNILKNSKRNYVSEIQINNINYIFKEPRNEHIIPQRKFFTLFNAGWGAGFAVFGVGRETQPPPAAALRAGADAGFVGKPV